MTLRDELAPDGLTEVATEFEKTLLLWRDKLTAAQTNGIITRADRQAMRDLRRDALAYARRLDAGYARWRLLYGFDPTYKGLHERVAYVRKSRTALQDNVDDIKDVATLRDLARGRRQAQKRLGARRRWMWTLPEPFNAPSTALTTVISTIRDAADFPNRSRAIRKRSRSELETLAAVIYAIRGNHSNVDGVYFPYLQAIAVGATVKSRRKRRA